MGTAIRLTGKIVTNLQKIMGNDAKKIRRQMNMTSREGEEVIAKTTRMPVMYFKFKDGDSAERKVIVTEYINSNAKKFDEWTADADILGIEVDASR